MRGNKNRSKNMETVQNGPTPMTSEELSIFLEKQINELAAFIMQNYPVDIQGGGAIETAIEILTKQRKIMGKLPMWIAEYSYKKANPDGKFSEPPSIVYEQIAKDFKDFLTQFDNIDEVDKSEGIKF